MAVVTEEEFSKFYYIHPTECDMDNDGQLMIYTGIFRWDDGSLHEEMEHVIEDRDDERPHLLP